MAPTRARVGAGLRDSKGPIYVLVLTVLVLVKHSRGENPFNYSITSDHGNTAEVIPEDP